MRSSRAALTCPSTPPRDRRLALFAGLLLPAVCLAALHLHGALEGASFWKALVSPDLTDMRDVLVHESVLPRIAMTLLCGTALGLAGVLVQQVLRNPLAEPMTLGIFPGAYLALSVASVWLPAWLVAGRETIALAGGALAMTVVLGLAWLQRLSSLAVILAGMVVNLYCGAISLAIGVMHFDLLQGLQIWGGGALDQTGWQPAARVAASVGGGAVASALLHRPLQLFDAGDATVRNLGVAVGWMRVVALLVAVALTASVVAQVGVIGFVGLAAPLLARLAGARRLRERLVWAPLLGAALLFLTDELVRVVTQGELFSAHLIPTGTVTSMIGVPLLVALLPRLRTTPDMHEAHDRGTALHGIRAMPLVWAALLLIACALSFVVTRGPDGWRLTRLADIDALMFWRVPHLLAALAAGSLLGTAGALLQRMTVNPMASPDLLGVGSGGMFGVVAVLLIAGSVEPAALFAGSVAGACVTLGLLLWLGRRAQFAPERLLLVGLSISALFQAVVGAVMASGDPRAGVLLDLLVGSTYYIEPAMASVMAALALLMLAVAPLFARWLAALGVGPQVAASIGVPVGRARFGLLLLAALSTAAATVVVGPLSFVGLIAPHVARLSGGRRPLPQLYLAAMLGALLMVVADWLGRQIPYPEQLPAGLVATLLGGPWLVTLILLRGARRT
ncbi:Fe3+-hydroxamate ABC transporter permease FhuB [Burkholderia sp. SFA1]|uniref:Fe(3+)-hydroxamate ABC transporter permease FhuB n=1 Tax=Caballeronia sp. CLC5 TaxID=2906764 RepID=UPI001F1C1954|nr:Fe(3+)-hydroxamate ABC transporter permease FhuB [Caballeronia sp. CLC5]MCE4573595.1 Fe(3+)-hydroxamate ABC transporter permease FhuB [Caballeronia sp. CLC5]BBQ00439.1 Fe3+-hydroxamate ABC transporter permease FhuB [Burkholderia sp. SFA1]